MTLLLETTFEPSLDQLVARYGTSIHAGGALEAWVFAAEAPRRAAEAKLAEAGVTARLRSAYKPLVHFFLEEVDLEGVTAVHIVCPTLATSPLRFRLEAYPLADMLGGIPLTLEDGAADGFGYEVALTTASGETRHSVFAPNRQHQDAMGHALVSPTGWIKWTGPNGESEDAAFLTDYQTLFDGAIAAVAEHPWGEDEPLFEELSIVATLPWADRPLPVGHETVSLAEALHEDLYFTLLELFQKRSGRKLGNRDLRPGQIVPDIRIAEGPLRLKVETRPLDTSEPERPRHDLETATNALSPHQVREALGGIDGDAFESRSRAGRRVNAVHHAGTDAGVIISGGQHANETSGVVGALRAAMRLAERPSTHFVISPMENVDGYALHGRLTATNPSHMHHAARYTAFGNDLEYETVEPLHEKAIRKEALRRSGALLHVNLHGYPAHEWTRPLTGYLPRGFEMWSLPKGFFLILRHYPDWTERGEALLEQVTAHLSAIPALTALNERQLSLYERHAGPPGFRMINGFPCQVTVTEQHPAPLILITEYPDETIEGEAFVDAHTAQMETVLSAYEAFQGLMRTS
ncbi:peptidase M14 [Consotaella aegiceratis]|uniref:peptidase M14 n=1 Tax=Consotaella aegiceratis TaxID=3097961 RepID=UPI002F3F43E7